MLSALAAGLCRPRRIVGKIASRLLPGLATLLRALSVLHATLGHLTGLLARLGRSLSVVGKIPFVLICHIFLHCGWNMSIKRQTQDLVPVKINVKVHIIMQIHICTI
jgi:hypothetical protein